MTSGLTVRAWGPPGCTKGSRCIPEKKKEKEKRKEADVIHGICLLRNSECITDAAGFLAPLLALTFTYPLLCSCKCTIQYTTQEVHTNTCPCVGLQIGNHVRDSHVALLIYFSIYKRLLLSNMFKSDFFFEGYLFKSD